MNKMKKLLQIILMFSILSMITAACNKTEEGMIKSSSEDQPTGTLIQANTESISQKIPTFTILNKHPKYNCLNDTFNTYINVFGIYVVSVDSAPEEYVIHTAKILAEYLDNNLDGKPDEESVLNYLIENNYVVPVWTESLRKEFWKNAAGTFCEDNTGMAASMYYNSDKWALGGIIKSGSWDTNLEEVWHIISKGWYAVYPEYFGDPNQKESVINQAMDIARGGKFNGIPSKYPESAWYSYTDETCDYHCQKAEYFYWALMSNIGALDPSITNKCKRSKDEWHICTKSELKTKDQKVHDLLNNQGFNLPINIPLGNYSVN